MAGKTLLDSTLAPVSPTGAQFAALVMNATAEQFKHLDTATLALLQFVVEGAWSTTGDQSCKAALQRFNAAVVPAAPRAMH